MNLEFAPSRSGLQTCSADGKMLHSAWDPRAEACRFLDAKGAGPNAEGSAYVLLVGPCLDYLAECIHERHPFATVVSAQLSPAFRGRERPGAAASWYPDEGLALDSFLTATMDQDALAPLFIVEWPPGVEAFPQEAREVRAAFSRAVERLASDAATIRAMGRRWIANSARNFLEADRFVSPHFGDRPIAILGAGPTLPRALELLGPLRESFSIVTVSSAAAAVLARGIEPDLVVSTDPGFWSRSHLGALAGGPTALGGGARALADGPTALVGGATALASPLSAYPGRRASPLLLLDQGWSFESELCAFLGKALRIPGHGTVAGSALAIGAALGGGPLIIAGFDFAATEAESHARPNAFEALVLAPESRLRPGESLRYARLLEQHPERLDSGGWRSSRALSIYARAIESDARGLGGRVARLLPSAVSLDGIPEIGPEELRSLARRPCAQRMRPEPADGPSEGQRKAWLAATLRKWRRAAEGLRPGGAAPPGQEDTNADILRCVDLPDFAALRRAGREGRDGSAALNRLEGELECFIDDLQRKLIA